MLAGAGIGDPTIASVHHYNATSELITFQLQVVSAGENTGNDEIKCVKVQLSQQGGNVVGSIMYAKLANSSAAALGDDFDQSLSAFSIVVATLSEDPVGYGCLSLELVVVSSPQALVPSVIGQTDASWDKYPVCNPSGALVRDGNLAALIRKNGSNIRTIPRLSSSGEENISSCLILHVNSLSNVLLLGVEVTGRPSLVGESTCNDSCSSESSGCTDSDMRNVLIVGASAMQSFEVSADDIFMVGSLQIGPASNGFKTYSFSFSSPMSSISHIGFCRGGGGNSKPNILIDSISLKSGTLVSSLPVRFSLRERLIIDGHLNCSLGSMCVATNSLGKGAFVDMLNLSANKLTGSILKEISTLTSLKLLNIHDNELTGTIPKDISTLTRLFDLSLYNNKLNGSIPKELSALVSLTLMELWDNQITGSIPKEFSDLASLSLMELSNNKITGSIPKELSALTSLTSMVLSNNKITGLIPKDLSALTSLEMLQLLNNNLTGSIPKDLSALTGISVMNISANKLAGSIPKEISTLTSLNVLHLHDNELTGTLPSELSALISLIELHLQNNKVTGFIQKELSALTNLIRLDLHNNNLTGVVPSSLKWMTKTTYFRLDENDSLCRLDALSTEVTEKCGPTMCPYPTCACSQTACPSGAENSGSTSTNEVSPFYPADSATCCPSGTNSIRERFVRAGHFDCSTGRPCRVYTGIPGKGTKYAGQFVYDNDNLRGTIPPQIGMMRKIYRIRFEYNNLFGTIPSELGYLRLTML
jgi:Leucine-rich repeat (LRR) protein